MSVSAIAVERVDMTKGEGNVDRERDQRSPCTLPDMVTKPAHYGCVETILLCVAASSYPTEGSGQCASAQKRLHEASERRRPEWLVDGWIGRVGQKVRRAWRERATGHEDHFCGELRRHPNQGGVELDAGHLRHHQVGENHVKIDVVLENFEGPTGGLHDGHVVFDRQDAFDCRAQHRLV